MCSFRQLGGCRPTSFALLRKATTLDRQSYSPTLHPPIAINRSINLAIQRSIKSMLRCLLGRLLRVRRCHALQRACVASGSESRSRRQKTQGEPPWAVMDPNETARGRRRHGRRHGRRQRAALPSLVPSSRLKSTCLVIAELDAPVDEPAPNSCCSQHLGQRRRATVGIHVDRSANREEKKVKEPKASADASLVTFRLLFVFTGAPAIERSSPRRHVQGPPISKCIILSGRIYRGCVSRVSQCVHRRDVAPHASVVGH